MLWQKFLKLPWKEFKNENNFEKHNNNSTFKMFFSIICFQQCLIFTFVETVSTETNSSFWVSFIRVKWDHGRLWGNLKFPFFQFRPPADCRNCNYRKKKNLKLNLQLVSTPRHPSSTLSEIRRKLGSIS